MGCTPYWVTFGEPSVSNRGLFAHLMRHPDAFYSHGAPHDVLYFEGSGVDRALYYPSMEATLRRP